MADGDLLVNISGAALSLLLYENVRNVGDQMGFLLGEIVEYIVKKFTDSDNQVDIKRHINIETVVTCSMPDILHDSTGRIDKEKLKDFLSYKSKQVIGWFRFRHNSCLVPTLRDKLLHKQFASHFSSSHGYKEDFFVTCLLSSSVSNTSGTHKFRHVLLRRRRGSYYRTFEPISLKISSLRDGEPSLDGSDYKLTPQTRSIGEIDTFTKIIQSLKLNLTQIPGIESATIIEKEAEKYLNTLIPKVCESDREVFELEKQIGELRDKIRLQNLAKTKINGNSESTKLNYDPDKNSSYEENNLSSEKTDAPGKIYEDDQLYKYHSLTDESSDNRPGSTRTVHTESVSKEKLKIGLNTDTQNSQTRDPFTTSMVSNAKLDMVGSTLKRNKCSTNMISEISRQSITMGDQIESGVGRGSPKYGQDLLKARRGSGLRHNNERNIGESSEQSSIKHTIQNQQQPPIYEETSKRNIDKRNFSDMSDTH
ncbi:BRISC complex subunit FAM175B-like isoform X1 [Vespa mandarinia]|uniref:BRISC complex subunit FAM175B-like isoform X1 n=1 Tax=Vespa mandarinia TaxID=7446 RepID=UPI0016192C5F|nr:BRISC complex subunit FAM175B-like isoform X1 [Vespa mandarinia]XP_035725868.1 BRISC complex subunit FAM175B-like isoform X1 [Vespa mandarinia]